MLAYTYMEHGRFSLIEKPVPELKDPRTPWCASRWEVFAPAIYTSSTAACRVLYRALRWGMRWWASWNK